MVARGHKSVKHDIISKDNGKILVAVAMAVFILVFCLFAIRTLLGLSGFHREVISQKKEALAQLRDNKEKVDELRVFYQAFIGEQQNVLGGSPNGTGPIDGNNAKLVIDALPGAYDFPALSSSIEKILKDGGYSIESIGGVADSANAQETDTELTTDASSQSEAIAVPYSFSISAPVDATKSLLQTLERSIRPIAVSSLTFQANESGLRSTVGFNTYYAPAKVFEINITEVKQ